MSKRFFTNEGENTLLKKFAGVFAAKQNIERFDALVGYLRASGYFALRPHLEKVPKIRIIVGVDVDNELANSSTGDMTVNIVETISRSIQGITRPFVCRGDDGWLYYVKGHGAGRQALIAEWIAGNLGKRLGLPIPDFK